MSGDEKDYDAAARWAEEAMTLPRGSRTALRGAAAAEFGRDLLAKARGGRPSLDPDAATGTHSRVRQVRLPDVLDSRLDRVAGAQGRKASVVLREAVKVYLDSVALTESLGARLAASVERLPMQEEEYQHAGAA